MGDFFFFSFSIMHTSGIRIPVLGVGFGVCFQLESLKQTAVV